MNPKPNPELIDEENPEWTDEMLAQAKPMIEVDPELAAMSKRARGRPKSENPKILLSVRYSPEVVAFFKSTGKGWQTLMDEVLRKYVAARQ